MISLSRIKEWTRENMHKAQKPIVVITALCFVLTFIFISFVNPFLLIVISLIYLGRQFVRKQIKEGIISRRRKIIFFILYFAFTCIFSLVCAVCVAVPIFIAYNVNKSIAFLEIILVFGFVVFRLVSSKTHRQGVHVSPFLLTGTLTLINFFIIIGLLQKTEKNYRKILSQPYVRPIVLSIDPNPKAGFYENVEDYPTIDGIPRQIVSDKEEKFLYVSIYASHVKGKHMTLYRIPLSNPASLRGLFSQDMRELALDEEEKRLFACNYGGEKILVIDTESFTVKKEMDVARTLSEKGFGDQTGLLKSRPDNLLIDKENNQLLVAIERGYLMSYNLNTLALRKISMLFDSHLSNLVQSMDGKKIFIGSGIIPIWQISGLLVTDVRSLKVIKKVGRFWFCRGLALSRKEPILYYVNILQGRIYRISTKDFSVKDEIVMESGIREVAEDPELPYLYVGSFTKGFLYVIDVRTKNIIRRFFVGSNLRNIYITPKTHRLLVATGYGIFEILPTWKGKYKQKK